MVDKRDEYRRARPSRAYRICKRALRTVGTAVTALWCVVTRIYKYTRLSVQHPDFDSLLLYETAAHIIIQNLIYEKI